MSLPLPFQFLVYALVGWVTRQQADMIAYLKEENVVLLEQLGGKKRLTFTDAQRNRLARKGKALGRAALAECATLVTPDTILRWYRKLVAKKYDSTGKRSRGRPRTRAEIETLVVQVATENPRFGYTRIRDTLYHLGHELGRSTVQAILERNGIKPAPERGKLTPWKDFLAAHWESVAAMDFFSVEVLTWRGLVRYQVLFVIDLATRHVEIAGIAPDPDGSWTLQVARNLTDAVDGFLLGKTHLIMDRDPLFSSAFRDLLRGAGVEPVVLPRRSPNLNSIAERWVSSVRREALRRVIPLGEAHLRQILRSYLVHYHRERHHQGHGPSAAEAGRPKTTPNPLLVPDKEVSHDGPIRCRKRLGGFLRYYYRGTA